MKADRGPRGRKKQPPRVADQVLYDLQSSGVEPSKEPEGKEYARLPSDVTEVSLQELGQRIGANTAMYGYFAEMVAVLDIEATQQYNELCEVEAQVSRDFPARVEKWRYENDLHNYRAWVVANQRLFITRSKVKYLKSRLDAYDRNVQCLSRELSRRKVEADLTQ